MEFESRYDPQTRQLTLKTGEVSTATEVRVQLIGAAPAEWSQSVEEKVAFFLQAARLPTAVKWMFKQRLPEFLAHPNHLLEIWQFFSPAQTLALLELIFGKQKDPISSDPDTALTNALNAAQKWMASTD